MNSLSFPRCPYTMCDTRDDEECISSFVESKQICDGLAWQQPMLEDDDVYIKILTHLLRPTDDSSTYQQYVRRPSFDPFDDMFEGCFSIWLRKADADLLA